MPALDSSYVRVFVDPKIGSEYPPVQLESIASREGAP